MSISVQTVRPIGNAKVNTARSMRSISAALLQSSDVSLLPEIDNRAKDTRLNRTVAIKVLPPQVTDRADLRQRLEREARTTAARLWEASQDSHQ
jgi:serine/threonine protein kinase